LSFHRRLTLDEFQRPGGNVAPDCAFVLQPGQQPAYVVRAGLWGAGDALQRELARHKHTAPLEDAGERPADDPAPLEAIAVRQAIAALDAAQRAVAARLATGRRRKEIADDLDIRSQSLTWHYAKLRGALAQVV
jgi:FixJ family two-component response regulator